MRREEKGRGKRRRDWKGKEGKGREKKRKEGNGREKKGREKRTREDNKRATMIISKELISLFCSVRVSISQDQMI